VPDSPEIVPFRLLRFSDVEQMRRSINFVASMISRRSVRSFSPEPVPFSLVHNAVAVANSAPSGANKQPWKFVVVENPELKRRIRVAAEREEWKFYHQPENEEWVQQVSALGTTWHKPFLENAPYLIVVFSEQYELRIEPDGSVTRHENYYVEESVGIAVGMLLCALHHSGLATLTHSAHPMDFVARELSRPENERPYLIIPVGHPAEDAMVPKLHKKSLEEVMIRY
jgi:nitroreductase